MYYDFFNLEEHPFRLTTDPRFLYLSKGHAQAKACMEFALRNDDNFVIVSGEIGSGKSLIIQDLIKNLDEKHHAIKIHQTLLSNVEFLQMLLLEFGIKSFHNRKVELIDRIRNCLLAFHKRGQRVLLIVDEAQNLYPEVLEEIRLLLDIEHEGQKLLSVFLVGQPELNQIIDHPDMEQLRQRARLRFHLQALDLDDISNYIHHRLTTAGEHHAASIDKEIFPVVQLYTGGRPRLINVLMDHALTCAYVDAEKVITQELILTSVEELNWRPYGEPVKEIKAADKSEALESADSMKIVLSKEGEVIGEYAIDKRRLNIGRHRHNDIVLNSPCISRHHAQIITRGDQVAIQDMNSKNGIYSGDKRVDFRTLHSGDVVKISDFDLVFIVENNSSNTKTEDDTESVNILQYPVSTNRN